MTSVDSKWIIGEFEFTSFYISIPSPAKRNRGCRWMDPIGPRRNSTCFRNGWKAD